MTKPHFVAHRGYSIRYPENTILAFSKAIDCGARFIELDVQMTGDLVPVILHDETLDRTTDAAGLVMDKNWDCLSSISAGETGRLGDGFKNEPLPGLGELVTLLKAHPDVTAFVELKEESINYFGVEIFVEKVLETLVPVLEQVIIISFAKEALIQSRGMGKQEIGWVLTTFDEESRLAAEELKPDILICNHTKVEGRLWKGQWSWFLYEITDPALALEWFNKGVEYIETMNIGEMIVALNEGGEL
ncbi:MAG: glycerophosphodiester phosphodiesterase family protein [bacterium]|nr:glycerophosphodiester phosphodiesterase family protein [bacterium]